MRRLNLAALLLLAALGLAGCTGIAAKGANLGLKGAEAVETRATEAVVRRQELRAEQRQIEDSRIQGLRAQAEVMRQSGDFDQWLDMLERAHAAAGDAMPSLDKLRAEIAKLLGRGRQPTPNEPE